MGVIILSGFADCVSDNRRVIQEAVLSRGFIIPFPVMQFKIMSFSRESVKQGLQVGNHYHKKESGREEFFVVLGGKSGLKYEPAIRFRYRESDGAIQEKELSVGDACYVPVGCSHAFMPLKPGLKLLGLCNMAYNKTNDTPDELF